jgi:hypothetical protein
MSAALQWMAADFTTNSDYYLKFVSETGRMANFNRIAEKYGKKVAMYELNHEVDAPSVAWCGGAPLNDPTYGGQSGKINQFLLAWLNSAEYEAVVMDILARFYARSQSIQSSIFGMATGNPWLTFQKLKPMTETLGGDTTTAPYAPWRAHARWNNSH